MRIWWLNQADCEMIESTRFVFPIDNPSYTTIPEYILHQFESLFGRPLRGRLWVDNIFEAENPSVDPWPDTVLANILAKNYGGIVIRDEDVEALSHLPGIFTDMKLNRVS
jgi:dTDP-4-dehydrorhamnose 3,5-epimerase-like enzyme